VIDKETEEQIKNGRFSDEPPLGLSYLVKDTSGSELNPFERQGQNKAKVKKS